MIRNAFLSLFLILLWLPACVTTNPTPEPTEIATAVPHTNTPLPMAVPPTSTNTPTAMSTDLPTLTATITLSPTATTIPTPLPTITPPTTQIKSQPEADSLMGLQVVNQMGGAVTAVAVEGNLAYLGIGARLAVADVSDPTQPRIIRWSGILPNIIHQIMLRDGLAYLALGKQGLWIFDITSLEPVGQVQTADPAEHFLLQDNLAFVVRTSGSPPTPQLMSIVDTSNPEQPVEINTFPLPTQPNKLLMIGGYLYILIDPNYSGFDKMLWVVDVTNPIQPVLVTAVPELAGRDMVQTNEGLVIAQGGSLILANISDPVHPQKLGESPYLLDYADINAIYQYENNIFAFSVFGDAGYCGSAIYIFDISDITNPQRLNTANSDCTIYDMTIANGNFYLATGHALVIMDLHKFPQMSYAGKISTLPFLDELEMGDYLFGLGRSGNSYEIFTFDIAYQAQPQLLSEYAVDYLVNDFAANASNVYLATYWQGIASLDLTDPTQPQEVAVTGGEYHAENSYNLVLTEDRLYAALNGNLGIFQPDTLAWAGGEIQEGYGRYGSFTVAENILWSWTGRDLQATDVSNPEQVMQISSLHDDANVQDSELLADQGYVYMIFGGDCSFTNVVICADNVLKIVNAVDPAQPSLVTTISIPPEIRHMTKFGNRLILVGDDLLFVDATNPNNVQILGQFATPGYARGVAVSSDFIYVNDGAAGIMVLKFDE